MTRPLFVYGTLRDPDQVFAVTGRRMSDLAPRPATLADHAVERVDGEDFPMLVQRPGSTTTGLLLSGFTTTDMRRLDAYETDAYVLSDIVVTTGEGPVTGQVYMPTAFVRSSGESWTLEQWRASRRRPPVRM